MPGPGNGFHAVATVPHVMCAPYVGHASQTGVAGEVMQTGDLSVPYVSLVNRPGARQRPGKDF